MQLAPVIGIRTGIAFLLYLRQGLFRRPVKLELKYINGTGGLDDAIRTAFALLLLYQHEVSAQYPEYEVKCIMEITLSFTLVFLAAHRIRYARKERCQLIS